VFILTRRRRRRRHRDLQAHARAAAGARQHVDPPAQQRGALAHDAQAEVAGVGAVGPRRRPAAVVVDQHLQRIATALDRDPGVARAGMAGDVGQRLLHDAVHLQVLRRAQPQAWRAVLHRQLDMRLRLQPGLAGLDHAAEAARVDRCAAVRQQLAQPGVGVADGTPQLGAVGTRGRGVAARDGVVEQHQPHLGEGHGLRHRVVHLGRHRLALGQHRRLQMLALQPLVVQRQPEQLADRAQQRGHRWFERGVAVGEEQVVQPEHLAPVRQRHRQDAREALTAQPVLAHAGRGGVAPGHVGVAGGPAADAAVAVDRARRRQQGGRQAVLGDELEAPPVSRQHAHHARLRPAELQHRQQETLQQRGQIAARGQARRELGDDARQDGRAHRQVADADIPPYWTAKRLMQAIRSDPALPGWVVVAHPSRL
jgi:hypothetical protein